MKWVEVQVRARHAFTFGSGVPLSAIDHVIWREKVWLSVYFWHLAFCWAGVSEVSAYIRGKAGTPVDITLRKRDGRVVKSRILRRAVPGGSAEILGSLFGNSSNAHYKEATTKEATVEGDQFDDDDVYYQFAN